MHYTPHILASGEELIVPIVIFVIWGLSAMAGIAKKANQTKTQVKRPVIVRRPAQDVRLSEFTIPARALQRPPQLAESIQRRLPPVAMRPVKQPVRPRPVVVAAPQPRQPIEMVSPPPPPVDLAPPPAPAAEPTEAAEAEVMLDPAGDDLRDRIKWMEILGKPLALREEF
jgi:hypothetical protein